MNIKQGFFTFLAGLLVYGLLFGALMYFVETDKNFGEALKAGLFFGVFMALGELFVLPKIKSFFSKKQ
ncbi:MAG TPA: hypothetical protein PKL92_06145 [Aquaticitalea sp.]|nr:hypothetical protein [Aquaticitalea sp.]HNU58396.1 hypothetical protein [Aquaticitalea sp.]